MITTDDRYRAAALLWLLEAEDRSERISRLLSAVDRGRRYREAQKLYAVYDRRAIDWCYASNLDRSSAAWRAVENWWPDDAEKPTSNILVLEGGKGSGKTVAAVGLLLRRGGEFVRAGSMHEIPLGDRGEATLQRLLWAPVLVFDNAGTEQDIGPTLARIHALFVHRDGARLPMIVTTTLVRDHRDDRGEEIDGVKPEKSFAGRYQDDILDRIDGDGEWVELDGKSRRGGPKPDLTAIERAAGLCDLYDDVVKVKRGGGSPVAITAFARIAGVTEAAILAKAEESRSGMAKAIAEMPESLRSNSVIARYLDVYGGVAPAES